MQGVTLVINTVFVSAPLSKALNPFSIHLLEVTEKAASYLRTWRQTGYKV